LGGYLPSARASIVYFGGVPEPQMCSNLQVESVADLVCIFLVSMCSAVGSFTRFNFASFDARWVHYCKLSMPFLITTSLYKQTK
jgi:hypothetical protein